MTRADAHGLGGLFQRVEKPRLSGLLSGWPRHVTPSVRSVPAADFPPHLQLSQGLCLETSRLQHQHWAAWAPALSPPLSGRG